MTTSSQLTRQEKKEVVESTLHKYRTYRHKLEPGRPYFILTTSGALLLYGFYKGMPNPAESTNMLTFELKDGTTKNIHINRVAGFFSANEVPTEYAKLIEIITPYF